jgi:ADP-ribose pyrophosphatase YjhB (NUDIX family)
MSQPKPHTFCSYCGTRYSAGQQSPLTCTGCGTTTWLNPAPVAVVLLPVDDGILAIRRNINPGKGQLALPGGYIDLGETWQQAAAREVYEETGIQIDPAQLSVLNVRSAPDDTLIIFARGPHLLAANLPPFVPSHETADRVVVTDPVKMAFGFHTELVRAFFEGH